MKMKAKTKFGKKYCLNILTCLLRETSKFPVNKKHCYTDVKVATQGSAMPVGVRSSGWGVKSMKVRALGL